MVVFFIYYHLTKNHNSLPQLEINIDPSVHYHPHIRDEWRIWILCCWESRSFHTILHLNHPLSDRMDQNNSFIKLVKTILTTKEIHFHECIIVLNL
jgi:hypothetical protein